MCGAADRQRGYGEEHGRIARRKAAIMAHEKEGGRTRRETSAGRGDSKRAGRTVEKAGQGGGVAMVDVDPWSSFFEMFLGQPAEGENADRDEGKREPAKAVRAPNKKLGRQGRSPRAS
jgi:hypothetical protein